MAKKISSWINALLGGIISLLGFSGCNILGLRCEYGAPHGEYKYFGEVTSETGKPLKNIQVVLHPYGVREGESYTYGDTLYTDSDGKFAKVIDLGFIGEDQVVKIKDVDGEENGGSFEEKVLEKKDLKIVQTKKGDKHWYRGAYDIEANASLRKKGE